jgi:nitrate reductase (cytochrome), electron transfer subunit
MMIKPENKAGMTLCVITSTCLILAAGIFFPSCSNQFDQPGYAQTLKVAVGFDSGSKKIFNSYDNVQDEYLIADSGGRDIAFFYDLRQYPGSPPQIPHKVEMPFSGKTDNCLSCHEKGGYNAKLGKSTPVTPHPEHSLCYQCHTIKPAENLFFVESSWTSVNPPRLGGAALPGGPPVIPHGLQMRENCIACHTGPGAVVELRVDHALRGNCRQCHADVPATAPLQIFKREQ